MKILFITITILLTDFTNGQIEFDIFKTQPKAQLKSFEKEKRLLNNSVRVSKNDSVSLFKYLNGEYYGIIGVGSPSKNFKVIFDTTWADSFFPSSHCSWIEFACKLHTQYDSSKSSTYRADGTPISIVDSEFSLSGFLSTDTIHLPHIKVENQIFLEATHMSLNPFLLYKADGIIGLAFKKISFFNTTYLPFFYNLLGQKIINDRIFTFYMNRDESTDRAGKVILGGVQRTHVKNGTLTTLDVVENAGYWMIEVDSIYATIKKMPYTICNKTNAIFDSSSNAITGPPEIIQNINYLLNAVYVPKLNKYSVSCREYTKLPKVAFVLNKTPFILESKYYIQRLTLDNIEICLSPFVPHQNKLEFWELGGAFMMEFYTEFDLQRNIINIGETIF